MKKSSTLFLITLLLLIQSCLFGAGKVEREITDDYWLFANSYLHEMSIWKDSRLVVDETVFAVGYDDNYIIVKSHPKEGDTLIKKDVTYFHIIEIDKDIRNINLTFEQFNLKKKELSFSPNLDFSLIFEELQ